MMRSLSHRCSSLRWYHIFAVLLIAAFFIFFSYKRRANFSTQNSSNEDKGLFKFDSYTREMQVRNLKGDLILQGNLGLNIDPGYTTPEESTENGLHYTWGDNLLSITTAEKNCLLIDWDKISEEPFTPTDCFSLGHSHWYGGGQLNIASWPLNRASIEMTPHYPKLLVGSAKKSQHYSSVFEAYWLTSSGVAIYVNKHTPLHVSFNANNNKKLCLKADLQGYPGHEPPVHLRYKLCFGGNIKSTHSYIAANFLDKPTAGLSSSFMQYPVCSLKSPTQNSLDWHFRSLVTRHFPCGTIDFGLQHDLEFNAKTFPDPLSLIEKIQRKKKATMVRIDVSSNKELNKEVMMFEKLLVHGNGVMSPNFANKKAVSWYQAKVEKFKEKYNIDLLRFCCGEIDLPVSLYNLTNFQNPGVIVQNYVKIAASVNSNTDVRVGFHTQSYPLAIRIADRNPEWGREMGLRSVIATVLSVGLVGYPFVLMGPIGGTSLIDVKPEKELYIRWMQMSIFFPVMEFVVYPWEYDDETIDISSEIIETRFSIWDNILATVKHGVKSGTPVIRPMWWIAPNDPKTHNLNGQFMLGDLYLVAPVVWKGKTTHELYLPKGVWREMFGKGTKYELEVGRWLTFNIQLRTIVYFECLICKE